ncbi:IclR family transcriptional regulator [Streptomyces sp. NPDC049040]|uniref:IclR family transcriptional regulator n=1 Tax=Streptomyces sp. NPDC049040 TaxID=3365593 RepID=UPI0037205237
MAALEEAGEAGLTRLASRSGLPKSTAYRLLEQLVELGAVQRRGACYRMGPRMFRLGQGWQPHPGLRQAAREPVRRLVAATGATVGVSVLWEGQTLVLDWAPGQDEALTPLLNGTSWPWYTAAGKVLTAWVPPTLPAGPMPATWAREAEEIRDRGSAFDREQIMPGVCCAAVPLRAGSGTVVGALCVLTAPSRRLEQLAEDARRTAAAISARLRGR